MLDSDASTACWAAMSVPAAMAAGIGPDPDAVPGTQGGLLEQRPVTQGAADTSSSGGTPVSSGSTGDAKRKKGQGKPRAKQTARARQDAMAAKPAVLYLRPAAEPVWQPSQACVETEYVSPMGATQNVLEPASPMGYSDATSQRSKTDLVSPMGDADLESEASAVPVARPMGRASKESQGV